MSEPTRAANISGPISDINANLNSIAELLASVQGPSDTRVTSAQMAVAQVLATCALVRAVQDLAAAMQGGRS